MTLRVQRKIANVIKIRTPTRIAWIGDLPRCWNVSTRPREGLRLRMQKWWMYILLVIRPSCDNSTMIGHWRKLLTEHIILFNINTTNIRSWIAIPPKTSKTISEKRSTLYWSIGSLLWQKKWPRHLKMSQTFA